VRGLQPYEAILGGSTGSNILTDNVTDSSFARLRPNHRGNTLGLLIRAQTAGAADDMGLCVDRSFGVSIDSNMSQSTRATSAAATSGICEEQARLESSYKLAKDAFDTARITIRQKVGTSSGGNS
jgi:hypothetical protein